MVFRSSIPILYSDNIKRSIDYYTQVLGFSHHWTWDDPPTFGGVSRDFVDIFFCEKGQGNPGSWLCIMVDQVDEFYENVRSKGGLILSRPEDKDFGIREMLVQDPDGHVLRFGQTAGPQREKSGAVPEQIRIVERIPELEEYQNLVRAVGWQVKEDEIIRRVLAAPLFAAVAIEGESGKTVGCVLVIGDHASFYYIKDMMVDPQWQNKRVGSLLMQTVENWLLKNAETDALVGLYTGEHLSAFYKQFGFKPSFGMSMRIRR